MQNPAPTKPYQVIKRFQLGPVSQKPGKIVELTDPQAARLTKGEVVPVDRYRVTHATFITGQTRSVNDELYLPVEIAKQHADFLELIEPQPPKPANK